MGGRLSPAVAATRVAVRAVLRDLRGSAVAVAVSGGADSLALLAAAAFEAPRAHVALVALTVDHGLQPGSDRQAARVCEQAAALGVDCEVLRVTVAPGGGPEAAARTARYAALAEAAGRLAVAGVLLGHTLDDQAETVLLGLARGSGARSLAGMAPVSGIYHRPFLGLRRATTYDACLAQGLAPWIDPMNDDPAYTRVRVRRDVMPALDRALGPGVPEALARTADALRDDADALDAWAERERTRATGEDGSLDVELLAALPRGVRTRILHRSAVLAGVPGGAVTAAHVRELDRLVTDWHGQGPIDLPAGCVARRACGRLHVSPGHPSRPEG